MSEAKGTPGLRSEDWARIEAAVMSRVAQGQASIDELVDAIGSTSTTVAPKAWPRPAAPDVTEVLPWQRPETPLPGLAYLNWGDADSEEIEAVKSDPKLKGRVLPDRFRAAELTVFPRVRLVQGVYLDAGIAVSDVFAAVGPLRRETGAVDAMGVHWFTGQGQAFRELREQTRFDLAADPAGYLRLFCSLISSDQGRFWIIDPKQFEGEGDGSVPWEAGAAGRGAAMVLALFKKENDGLRPLRMTAVQPGGAFEYEAPVLYGTQLFQAKFHLRYDGGIEMVSDEAVGGALPICA